MVSSKAICQKRPKLVRGHDIFDFPAFNWLSNRFHKKIRLRPSQLFAIVHEKRKALSVHHVCISWARIDVSKQSGILPFWCGLMIFFSGWLLVKTNSSFHRENAIISHFRLLFSWSDVSTVLALGFEPWALFWSFSSNWTTKTSLFEGIWTEIGLERSKTLVGSQNARFWEQKKSVEG